MKNKNYIRNLVYKINSSRFRNNKWSLDLSIENAIRKEEIVTLSDSQALIFVKKLNGINPNKLNSDTKELRNKINKLKSRKNGKLAREKIKEYYKELNEKELIDGYIMVTIESEKDFDIMNERGFYFNGKLYKRFLATTGGAKVSTVIYVKEEIHKGLISMIDNGRDQQKEMVPAKLEAYRALACSASSEVTNTSNVLVVDDLITTFKDDIILIDDSNMAKGLSKYPEVTEINNYEINLNANDGFGLIDPQFSLKWSKDIADIEEYISGFCIRHSFCKGMLFTFDFKLFMREVVNNKKVVVKDVWGKEYNYEDLLSIDIILTTSMLKLWDSYSSVEDYIKNCSKNGYQFRVTKSAPLKLEDERNLNYQFIQSFELDDNDIKELISPTVNELKDVLSNDYRKAIMFANGIKKDKDINKMDNDVFKALIVDGRNVIKDSFIKSKLKMMTNKKIKEAKMGVLKVKGNYSIVSGDPYALCENIFGLEVKGLLNKNEYYSNYWNEKNVSKSLCFRAPMSCHNNIRMLNYMNNSNLNYWFKYMTTVIIFNSWDTTTHSLNGNDYDSDILFTTNSESLMRNHIKTKAIVCLQKNADKKISQEEDFIKVNKESFGDEIGAVTNRITAMFDVRSRFSKESDEYKELTYRIMCGQNFQQNSIDKIKGCQYIPMPTEWYTYRDAKETDTSERDKSIVADKKPYFFIYNYDSLKKQYHSYIENVESNCIIKFGLSLDQLKLKNDKNEDEEYFLYWVEANNPVFTDNSTMNKISRAVEEEFKELKLKMLEDDFNYEIYKSDTGYNKKTYLFVESFYQEYKDRIKNYYTNKERSKKTSRLLEAEMRRNSREMFINEFKEKCFSVCNNEEELTNIVIDLCYKTNKDGSKQFAWDICGEQIINNLLFKNNYKLELPIENENGDFEFYGKNYSMEEFLMEEKYSEYKSE